MFMHRKRADKSQQPIIDALRKIGAKVVSASQLGHFPDLIVGYRKRTILMECKTPGEKAKKKDTDFVANWPGEVHIVYTPEEAIAACTRADVI